ERGLAARASAVTVVGVSSVINSLHAGPEYLAEAAMFTGSNDYRFGGCPLFALNPLHASALAKTGVRKPDLKQRIWELSRKRVRDFDRRDLLRDELGSLDDPDGWVPLA